MVVIDDLEILAFRNDGDLDWLLFLLVEYEWPICEVVLGTRAF